MTNIWFQNGMLNSAEDAMATRDLLVSLVGPDGKTRSIGVIINQTGKVLSDVEEYLPNRLYLKDALNGEVYRQIANNGESRNLVIMHSAGNEDLYKGLSTLSLSGVKLNNNIDFISVGSPRGASSLSNIITQTNAGSLQGQYNNWKDPVTHSKTWAAGIIGAAFVGGYAGSAYAAASGVSTGTGLEVLATGAVGAGIGGIASGGTTFGGIKLYHPMKDYLVTNHKGVTTAIVKWSNEHPAVNNQ